MKKIKTLVLISLIACSLTAKAGDLKPLDINEVTLTRFAIHSLYAPKRLLSTPEGVYRVPMETEKHVPLFYGASLDAMPLASWRAGSLYVTAIELKNLTTHPINIDLKQLRGNWQTAALYPSQRLKSRDAHETTSLFLISDAPLSAARTQNKGFIR